MECIYYNYLWHGLFVKEKIRAYHALSQDERFMKAGNWEAARMAARDWERQYAWDDVTGESYLPSEKFSNFALLMATMYKGETQNHIRGTFDRLFDLIQGVQEETLFEKPDNTPRTLAQAIKETLNIDYNGHYGSHVLAGTAATGQRGQRNGRGSAGDDTAGERDEGERGAAERAGGTGRESTADNASVHQPRPERKGSEQTSDVGRQGDGAGVADDTAREMAQSGNRSDIRVFEEGLAASRREHSDDSERNRREAESERLVSIAKRHGLFIPAKVIKASAGRKVGKRTGESDVYIDRKAGKVTKVKDPYAKAAMKSGVQPEDAAFEHLVHNLLFPETAYTLEGISEEAGDVRLVLSQRHIQNYRQPAKEQIAEALAAKGLSPEDNYSFGNEFVSVTDVEGDNVLSGDDGSVYFIDPIIRFKKPLQEIIAALEKVGKLQYRFDGGAQTEHRPADVSVTVSPRSTQGTSMVSRKVKASNNKDPKVAHAIHTSGKQPTETAGTSQETEQGGTRVSSSMNAPTPGSILNGKLVWKHADYVSAASDVADGLYSPQGNLSDPATEGTDAPQTNSTGESTKKLINSNRHDVHLRQCSSARTRSKSIRATTRVRSTVSRNR